MKKELALVFLVAGMSSRFGGKIKSLEVVGPKGETLLEYSMNQALKSPFTKIILIVGKHTEKQFKEKFGNNYKGIPVSYAFQNFDKDSRDKPWGTADALLSAKPLLDCPFVVCNGDDLYGETPFRILAEYLSKKNFCATIGFPLRFVLPEKGKVNRGIFQIDKKQVKNIEEFYSIENNNFLEKGLNLDSLCSMNIYGLQPEILELLENQLIEFKNQNKQSRNAEALIQKELSNLIKQNKIQMEVYPLGNFWIGITNSGDEELVKEFLKNKKKNIALVYMLAGMSSRFGKKNKSLEVVGPKGETLLEYSLNQALNLDFSKIIFIVGKHNLHEFKEKFGNNYKGIPIEYFIQEYNENSRDRPLGTGDAICSINKINCPFVICSGDDIYGSQNLELLFNHLLKEESEATIGIKLKKMVPEKGKVNRGIFQLQGDSVLDIHETCGISKEDLIAQKLNPESFCSMSLFALHPETLSLLKQKLETFKKQNQHDRKIEFFLPEALANLIKENKIKMKLYPAKNKWFGITNIGDEIILKENLRQDN